MSFCAWGAFRAANTEGMAMHCLRAMQRAADPDGGEVCIVAYNDKRAICKGDVLALFDRAIAAQKGAE